MGSTTQRLNHSRRRFLRFLTGRLQVSRLHASHATPHRNDDAKGWTDTPPLTLLRLLLLPH